MWNLGIQWHVPSSEEVSFAFYLLDSFLQPELIKLQCCGDGELEMSRLVFFYYYLSNLSACPNLCYLMYVFSSFFLNLLLKVSLILCAWVLPLHIYTMCVPTGCRNHRRLWVPWNVDLVVVSRRVVSGNWAICSPMIHKHNQCLFLKCALNVLRKTLNTM